MLYNSFFFFNKKVNCFCYCSNEIDRLCAGTFSQEEIVKLGMFLLEFLPTKLVNTTVVNLEKLKHGDMSKYGLETPKERPSFLIQMTVLPYH